MEVVELREGSPAIGLYPAELMLADAEAVVLAVMSGSTRDLVESETHHRCQVGDRVVVAAREARIAEVTAALQPQTPDSSSPRVADLLAACHAGRAPAEGPQWRHLRTDLPMPRPPSSFASIPASDPSVEEVCDAFSRIAPAGWSDRSSTPT